MLSSTFLSMPPSVLVGHKGTTTDPLIVDGFDGRRGRGGSVCLLDFSPHDFDLTAVCLKVWTYSWQENAYKPLEPSWNGPLPIPISSSLTIFPQKSLIDPLLFYILTISFFIKPIRSCDSRQSRFSSPLVPPVSRPICRSSIVCNFQLFSCPSIDIVPQPPSSEARLTSS